VRRRLLKYVAGAVLVPVLAWGAETVAARLEAKRGESTASRSLHRAARIARRTSSRRYRRY